jgi:AraC-like DNA-binding protein
MLPRGDVIGPITSPGPPTVPVRAESIGAYFCAGAVIPSCPALELENRVIALEDLGGAMGCQLGRELWDARSEGARIDRLESALAQRAAAVRQIRSAPLDISRMAAWVVQSAGHFSVERLAEAAGLSRRHFIRVFRDSTGVSPKVYCRLARFRSALAYVRRARTSDGRKSRSN